MTQIETVRRRGEQLNLLCFDAIVEILEIVHGKVLPIVDSLVVPAEIAERHAVLHSWIVQIGVEQQTREEKRIKSVSREEGTRIDFIHHFGEIGHNAIDDLGFAWNAECAQEIAKNRIQREIREGERTDEGASQLGEEGVSFFTEGKSFAQNSFVDFYRFAKQFSDGLHVVLPSDQSFFLWVNQSIESNNEVGHPGIRLKVRIEQLRELVENLLPLSLLQNLRVGARNEERATRRTARRGWDRRFRLPD